VSFNAVLSHGLSDLCGCSAPAPAPVEQRKPDNLPPTGVTLSTVVSGKSIDDFNEHADQFRAAISQAAAVPKDYVEITSIKPYARRRTLLQAPPTLEVCSSVRIWFPESHPSFCLCVAMDSTCVFS
jgi:hypothetical protein